MDKKHAVVTRTIVMSGLRTMAWWYFASILILLAVSYQHLGQTWLNAAVMALVIAVVAAVFRFLIALNQSRVEQQDQ